MGEILQHRVGSLKFNLELDEDEHRQFSRTGIVRYLTHELLPEMETLFDSINPEARIVIPKLELRLGNINGKNWKSHLGIKLLNQLKDSLLKSTHLTGEASTLSESRNFNDVHKSVGDLLYYLIYGHLPSRSSRADIDDFLTDRIVQDKKQLDVIFSKIGNRHSAVSRFVQMLTQSQREFLVTKRYRSENFKQTLYFFRESINEGSNQVWERTIWIMLIKLLEEKYSGTDTARKSGLKLIMTHVAHFYFSSASSKSSTSSRTESTNISIVKQEEQQRKFPQADTEKRYQKLNKGININGDVCSVNLKEYLIPLGTRWARKLTISDNVYLHFTPKKQTWDALVYELQKGKDIDELFEWELSATLPEEYSGNNKKPGIPDMAELSKTEAELNRDNPRETSTAVPHQSPVSEAAAENKPSVGEELNISGAGAVIFHPFIKELFASQKMLDGESFIDERCQEAAVRMLAYLTYGDENVQEYDMQLAKILCGIPLDNALTNEPLSIEQIKACDELLNAILNHWKALNSTSPLWLRQQFFIREGQLKFTDENIQLSIRGKAQDILLKRLPWGIGIIALPWMEYPLFTQWEGH